MRQSSCSRFLVILLLFGIGLTSVDEATASSRERKVIKKLKKENRALKRTASELRISLANALRPVPKPESFIEMVFVGDPGNPADPSDGDSSTIETENFGSVPYLYSIGRYEVTLNQYSNFLNAVAASDPNDLWHNNLGTHPHIRGIIRSGSDGNFTYEVFGDGDRPVSNVSWFDAARFCNWLHNGRPSGPQGPMTTEDGTYSLNGASSGEFHRNWGARFWIPSENEWYKAAFYHPASDNGPSDSYWLYPTSSDSAPGHDRGNLPNQANIRTPGGFFAATGNSTTESVNYLFPAGTFSASASYYGTFDQAGNLEEWNDSVLDDGDLKRGKRGGSWFNGDEGIQSNRRTFTTPDTQGNVIGFRVAGTEWASEFN
ncbi:MAG: SUMF1/EgtB/PvdO family nonheme iron enzyme [Verrucomicrobiota bacterium]